MHYFHTHVEMNGTSLMLMRLWIGQELIFNLLMIRIRIYMRPEMKSTRNEISTHHKRNSVYITFHCRRSENEISFSGVVREKQPIQ